METNAIAVRETLGDIEKMAQRMVASKLFGVQNTDQAVSLMLIAQAEGMHPALAARDYHIIQGRHTLKADAMLARFQQSGGKVEWNEYTDTKVSAMFSHPSSPKPVLIEWDMNRATQAGIGGKDNWKKYPRQMLKARVVSDGVRLCYPGCAVGVYTPEEAQDFDSPTHVREVRVMPQPEQPKVIEQAVVDAMVEDKPYNENETEFGSPVERITETNRKQLFAMLKKAGATHENFKQYLVDKFAIESTKDIPSFLFEQIKEEIETGKVNA